MSGHADAVHRAALVRRCSSEPCSGVGVAPQLELGFLASSPAWPLRSYLELGALPSAPGCARGHTKALLREWGLGELVDVTELLVSELITNAVATTAKHHLDTPVRWRLSSDRKRVLIEVWDGNATPPPAASAEPPPLMDESGRGLLLVDALSTKWSWYTLPSVPGKVIWAEVGP